MTNPDQTATAADIERITKTVIEARPEWHGAQVARTLWESRTLATTDTLTDVARRVAADRTAQTPAVIGYRLRTAQTYGPAQVGTGETHRGRLGSCATCGKSWRQCMEAARPLTRTPDDYDNHVFETEAELRARLDRERAAAAERQAS